MSAREGLASPDEVFGEFAWQIPSPKKRSTGSVRA